MKTGTGAEVDAIAEPEVAEPRDATESARYATWLRGDALSGLNPFVAVRLYLSPSSPHGGGLRSFLSPRREEEGMGAARGDMTDICWRPPVELEAAGWVSSGGWRAEAELEAGGWVEREWRRVERRELLASGWG